MKQNIDFFTHDTDAHEHPKHELLIATYGYEGYGRFWALNEMIGRAAEARLDLSVKRNRSKVANVLNMTLPELDEFIDFLSSDECELVDKSDDYVLTTERTQHDLGYAMSTREAARKRKSGSSGEPNESSGELSESSGEKIYEGRKGREGNEEKEGRTRASTRDACAAPDFLPWLTSLLRSERNLANPAAFARRVQQSPGKYPDLIDRYIDEHSEPERGSPAVICPHCHKPTVFSFDAIRDGVGSGVRRCASCGEAISEFEDDVPFTAEG